MTFRVLVIGRANAGKTSLLQRVCDTTDSPEVYRVGQRVGRRLQRVCSVFVVALSISYSGQVLLEPTMEVVHAYAR